MSIYSALSLQEPTITYSALHQLKKGMEVKDYVKTMKEMDSMVRAESEKVKEIWRNHLAELRASSAQTTRGTLSQFLTLPLQSDVKEVNRILEDHVNQFLKQLLPSSRPGVVTSTEGRFVWDREQNATLESFLSRGREYLKKLRFKPAESDRDIFESDFVVEGGQNLDIIEHIVRDRMGIYATAHGQHTRETDSFVFAAHNIAYLQGSLEASDSKYEAVIHFAKGKSQYDPFRTEVSEVLDAAQGEFKFSHLSMWQRKLGLGGGAEFHIRARTNERKVFKEFILSLAKKKERKLVYDSIVKNGSLLVKELIE